MFEDTLSKIKRELETIKNMENNANKVIEQVGKALIHMAVETCASTTLDDKRALLYCCNNDRWGLYVRNYEGCKPLARAPRIYRIAACEKMEELLQIL